MVIKASSGRQVDALITDLGSDDAAAREAAIARLTVIGSRAVDRLVQIAGSDAAPAARIGAFHALDAIGDPRAVPPALRGLHDVTAAVATAAVAALRGSLRGPRGLEILDALAGVALDRARPGGVRVAAVRALGDLPTVTLAPIWSQLGDDPDAAVRREVSAAASGRPATAPADVLALAARGEVPETPETLRDALTHAGGSVPLTMIHLIIERVRDREATDLQHRAAWTVVRGAAHAILAGHGSRLGVYDLKESLEHADAPLPVAFLSALGSLGDAACLDAIASAYARANAGAPEHPDWWRSHLADAFRTIVKRERLTRRHAALKRIARRWPGPFAELLG